MKKITKKDEKVIKLLVEEGLTIKQASHRLKVSERTMYRYAEKLSELGLLKKAFMDLNVSRGGYSKPTDKNTDNLLRLHNIQESIKIISKGKKYVQFLGTTNKFSLSGVTILCYYDKIDIYTQEGMNFYGVTTDECYGKAINFFSLVYAKIENRLNIIIEKDQYLNKKWVRQHIAETNSEVAKEQNKIGERITDKAEDGKTWLLTDKSLGGNELEFVHPVTAKDDTEKVLRYIRDMRKNPDSLTLSEISRVLREILDIQKEQASGLLSVIDMIKPMNNIIKEEKIDKNMTEYIG